MIVSAERRFPVRIRVAVQPGGFGQRHSQIRLGSTRIAAPKAGQ
jgi:hypothetical protein